jgi:hypothetical protein
MDTTYISLFFIIIITIFYYQGGKIPLTPENNDKYANLPRSIIYFFLLLISQILINMFYIINKCGSSTWKSLGVSTVITFFPWFFIFGILVAIMTIFPDIKSCFSNVVGYFAIYSKANELLNTLLMDAKINESIESSGISPDDKTKYNKVAETILKIIGNKSILINEITPYNFNEMWTTFEPLIKPEITQNTAELQDYKTKLFEIVQTKDNIGEAMWYLYTAILLVSIVSYQLSIKGCTKDISKMKAEHDAYLKKEEELNAQKQLASSTIYTLS